MQRHVRSILVACVVVVALAAVLATSATAAPASRAKLNGSVPKWALPSALKAAADPSQRLNFQVYLGWRDASAARALARAVSNPASALYGHYLSPAKFRRLFAPSAVSVAAVRTWLASQGFAVTGVPGNKLYVAASGTVAQAEKAFGVRLNQYTTDGQTLRAPASALSIPASLSGIVTAVVGLDQSKAHPQSSTDNAPPPAGFRNAQPWSTFWGQNIATDLPMGYGHYLPYATRGYTPSQLRGAYGVTNAIRHGNDGTGVTVAIIDAYAAPTIVYDVNRYSHDNGVPAFKRGQFRQILDPGLATQPPQDDESGWYGEETLDIEAVHSMAPGAKIVFLGALNSEDESLDVMMNYVVDHRVARIVSNSYGELGEQLPPELIKAENSIYLQAALEGIGVYFSSGDDGDEVDTLGYRTRRLAGVEPLGDRRGRHQPRRRGPQQLPLRDRLGHEPQRARQRRLGARPSGRLVVRRRRRHERAVRAALVSAQGRAGRDRRLLRHRQQVACRARRGHGRRPDDRHARRRDADLLRRRLLRHLPHRRDQPLVPAVRRHGWPSPTSGRASRTGSPTRCCTVWPAVAPTATSSTRRRRSRPCAATSQMVRTAPTAWTSRCAP